MEETGPQNPVEDILTPRDSLEATTAMSVTPAVGTSLEGNGVVAQAPVAVPTISELGAVPQKHIANFMQNKLIKKVFLTSAILLAFILLIVGGTILYQRTHAPVLSPADQLAKIKDQSVQLNSADTLNGSSTLRVGVATLSINGDLAVNGIMRFNSGGFYGQFSTETLTANQTYTLPNASGTVCLDSGNCDFASAAQVAALQAATGASLLAAAESNGSVRSLNDQVGALSLQGTANQVVITTNGGTISFALPQDIGQTSSPEFNSLTLAAVGTQNGSNICDASNNCAYVSTANGLIQGGNNFGTNVIMGATNNSGVILISNNTQRLSVDNNGLISLGGATTDRLQVLAEIIGSQPLVFQGQTDDFFRTTLQIADPTANRNIILPNADGTVCLTSGNCSGAGGYGDILNGGNTFNDNIVIGTNDFFGVSLKTFNTTRFSITNTGDISLIGNTAVNGNVSLGTNSSSGITMVGQILGGAPLVFQGATNDSFATSFVISDPTANRTIVFPNADGTVCLSSGNCSGIGGTGDVLQGGNNFVATMVLGTNDDFGFNLKTNGAERLTITNTGIATFTSDLLVNGNTTLGDTNADRVTVNGQIAGGTPFVFQGATNDSFATFFVVNDPTTNRNIILPDADGTICLSSGNCTMSGGSGDVNNGGNSYTGAMSLGTNNNFGLTLKTDNTSRITISNLGLTTVLANFVVNGNTLLGASSANSLTLQGTNLFVPNDLNIDTYTQYIDSLNNTVGFGTIPGAGSRVNILAVTGGDALTVNNGNTTGNILNLQDNGVNVATVADTGATTFRNSTNSTAAFQIQNAAGATVVSTDTVNRTLSVNGGPSTYTFTPPGPILGSETPYTTGNVPLSIGNGLFNNDAFPDLVTANSNSNTISVFINNGVGGFASKVDYPTNTRPERVTVGDFNGDGRADIAVTNLTVARMSVFINNGNGTFAGRVDYITGTSPAGISNALFNNDAFPDLVVANSGSNTISVFINSGTGTFAAKVDYPTGTAPNGVTTADLNNDGRADIIAPNSNSNTASVFINSGTGTFAAKVDYPTASGPTTVAAADFNGDSRPDLAITNYNAGTISILINTGTGTFGTKTDYAVGTLPIDIVSADFNGDGIKDLVVSNSTGQSVSLLLGNGTGAFSPKVDYSIGANLSGITAADFNADGKMDVAETHGTGTQMGVLLGSGSSTTVRNSLSVSVATVNDTALYIRPVAGQVADIIRVTNPSNVSISMFTMAADGSILFRNAADSATGFQIQNTAGTTLLQADTLNNNLRIGSATADATGALLVLDTKNTTGDPAGTNGAMYYNSFLGKMRCYEGGVWSNCISAGGTGGDILNGGNTGLGNITIGTNDNFTLGFETAGNTIASFTTGGAAQFKNFTNSTTAFQVQNVAGQNLFNVDSANTNITLNGVGTGDLQPWVTNTNSLPAGRAQAAAVTANGYVYVTGGGLGTAASTVYYAKINADGSLGTWTTNAYGIGCATPGCGSPAVRVSHTTVTANGFIYIIGGRDGANVEQTSVYVARLNPDGSTSAWGLISNLPATRASHSSVTANGYVYVMGGEIGTTAQTTVYYAKLNPDGSLGSWVTSSNPLNASATNTSATVSNGYVYIAGGGAGSNYQSIVRSAKLNVDGTTSAWSANTVLPNNIKLHSMISMNGYIYAVAGVDAGTPRDGTFYARVGSTGTLGAWQASTNLMPSGRYWGSAVNANGYIYHMGGTQGSGAFNTVYYTSTSRVSIGGSLDLIGVAGGEGTSGGSLTATNGTFMGRLQVNGAASVVGNTNISGNLSVFGQIAFQNYTNSESAFRIQDSSGNPLFNVDTMYNLVSIGGGAVNANPTVLQLGNSNSASDPTGYDGAMYYNVVLNKFRCYENGTWKNCITPAGAGTGDILNNGNTGMGAITIGNIDNDRLDLITNNAIRLRVTSGGSVMVNSTGTAGAYERFRVNTPTTIDNTTSTILSAATSLHKALVIQGAAGQLGNLTEWQDSTGAMVLGIHNSGSMIFGQGANRSITVAASTTLDGNGYNLAVQAGAANGTGTGGELSLSGGTGTSASGAITLTTAASFGVSGNINLTTGGAGYAGGTINLQTGINGSSVYTAINLNNAGGRVNIGTALNSAKLSIVNDNSVATDIALLVRGATGQSAVLQSWQNSATAQVASVSNTGVGSFSNLLQNGNQVCDASGNCASTLQAIYNNSTNPEIVLGSGANAGLTIRNNATPIAGNLFEIQNNAGSVTYFKVDTNGIDVTTGSIKTNGTDRISNSGTLLNVTYNGNTIGTGYGGTGAASFTSNGILFGNGAGTLQATAAGNSGQCLIATTGSAPTWGSCAPAASGNVNQGGNTYGMGMSIGTTDNFGLTLLVDNHGALEFDDEARAIFQNKSDATTAFQVQNAAGTSLFNIDSTNNRIYVGNATPDSIGTLLVLDTKNTSGDPAGVDGAMYYNSNLAKFRCYENGEWKDCIYNSKTASKTADQTFSSSSYANVNDLSFAVVANRAYRLQCSLLVSVPSATVGGNVSTTGPAGPTQYTATFLKSLDQSGGDNYATSSTFDDGNAAATFRVNTISTGSNRFILNFNAVLVNGASSGTWQLRAKHFDGSSSITFYANSSCNMLPL